MRSCSKWAKNLLPRSEATDKTSSLAKISKERKIGRKYFEDHYNLEAPSSTPLISPRSKAPAFPETRKGQKISGNFFFCFVILRRLRAPVGGGGPRRGGGGDSLYFPSSSGEEKGKKSPPSTAPPLKSGLIDDLRSERGGGGRKTNPKIPNFNLNLGNSIFLSD